MALPADLPVCSGRDAVRAFVLSGWIVRRQRGSDIVLTRQGSIVSLSVPDHGELAPGTLRKLIRLSGMTVEEFAAALR
jgi:predicted RNA binding protein YcfA (HicA-like mRNA interferase family)